MRIYWKPKRDNLFGIFIHKENKKFHIWQSYTGNKNNVSISNAYWKSTKGVTGRDEDSFTASVGFMRNMLVTGGKGWDFHIEHIGVVSQEVYIEELQAQIELLEEQGYECCSHDPTIKIGKIGNRKWKTSHYRATLISNLPTDRIKKHIKNMLIDCNFNPETSDYTKEVNKETNYVVFGNGGMNGIDNISQLWKYIYEKYAYGSMV